MGYFLFLLTTAAFFVRPVEIFPALQGYEIYVYLIVACLAFSTLAIFQTLTEKSLVDQPITLAVFGLLAMIYISDAVGGDPAEAGRKAWYFAKIVVYYLLFISLVTTPARLRTLLLCVLVCSATVALLAALRFHEVIQLDTVKPLADNLDSQFGEKEEKFFRLQGTGAFNDPNELCVLLACMTPVCLYFLMTSRHILLRLLCGPILAVCGYAAYLTQSRGGFLALVGGLGVLFWARYGWKKSLWIAALGLPILLVLFAGRMTQISHKAGTAHERIGYWYDWMMTFRENPVIGNSMSLQKDEDQDKANRRSDVSRRHLAHNSYLQAYADLGILGGTLFIGAIFTAIWSVYRFYGRGCVQANADLRQLQPYVLATIVSYGIGMLTLTICYHAATYIMLALAVAYTRMAQRSCLFAPAPLRIETSLIGRCGALGACFLVAMYLFVRTFG